MMVRLRHRVNGGIVNVDEDFAAQLDPADWEPAEKGEPAKKATPSKPARQSRKKAGDDSGDTGD